MLTATDFHDYVSGRRKGIGAALVRAMLRAAEAPYTGAVRWRNHRFDRGHARIASVGVPVVSIGNLTLGGTGKTPMVQWLVRRLLEFKAKPAIVSRGYKAKDDEPNDEALELVRSFPGVPHVQNPNRVAAARTAVEQHGVNIIVLDDGFQHRRLHRDLDIVLLDSTAPFGYGYVFPRGLLREPREGLKRADVVVLTRTDCVDAEQRRRIQKEAARLAPQAAWAEAAHAPQRLVSAMGKTTALDKLRDDTACVFCGIGNPAAFQKTVEGLGCRIAAFREFPDHYDYEQHDVHELTAWARTSGRGRVICTVKDLVKLQQLDLQDAEIWAVEIGLEILAGEESIIDRVKDLLERRLRE